MAKNLLKRNQVVSVDDHQNKTDKKKRKLEEVHQKSLTCGPVGRNFKVNNIVRLCKKASSKCFKDKCVSRTGNHLF